MPLGVLVGIASLMVGGWSVGVTCDFIALVVVSGGNEFRP